MERLTRLLGIGLLVTLAALSISSFRETLDDATKDSGSDPAEAVVEEPEPDVDLADEQGAPPEYLTFSAGFRSGVYDVAELTERDPGRTGTDSDADADDDIDDGADDQVLPNSAVTGAGRLAPGLYATAFGVEDCSFELRRIMRTESEAVIGTDRLDEGRMLVTINEIEPDSFTASPRCGEWVPWSPVVEPLTVAGDGDYWIGDLEPGTWTVPDGCMWEKVVGFRGAKLWDVQDSGFGPDEPLVIDDDTVGVRIRGCHSDFVHDSLL